MASYEGVVVAISEEGRARVVVRPDAPGIVGAPGLPVCHAATESSSVTIEALNPAGAAPGDVVLVTGPGTAQMKNVLIFLGLILCGVAVGFLIFRLVANSWAFGAYAGALVWMAGIVPGALLVVLLLRRGKAGGALLIDRILRKGGPEEGATCLAAGRKRSSASGGCEGCRARF